MGVVYQPPNRCNFRPCLYLIPTQHRLPAQQNDGGKAEEVGLAWHPVLLLLHGLFYHGPKLRWGCIWPFFRHRNHSLRTDSGPVAYIHADPALRPLCLGRV